MSNWIKTTHRTKFANYIEMCEKSQAPMILVANMQVLWDTMQEVLQNIAIALKHKKVITVVNGWQAFNISGPLT